MQIGTVVPIFDNRKILKQISTNSVMKIFAVAI